jgi:spore germination protein KC
MIRLLLLICISVLIVSSTSGCTDFVEPNQLAFVMGSAIDHAANGEIEVSHQIVIPAQLRPGNESNSEHFLIISATGKNVFEANQEIQRKLSRRLMMSHRILVAISESFIDNHDLSTLFDKLGRDPANNMRDLILIVRKSSGKDFLKLKHPIEALSTIAAEKELKMNGLRNFSTRQLVIDSPLKGIRPILPFLQIENMDLGRKEDTIAVLSGFAVLNNELKVKGFLNNIEGRSTVWMAGKGMFGGLTVPWKSDKGTLSFRLTHLERHIHNSSSQDPKHVVLTVKAQAYLLENTTSLDMSDVNNMIAVQKYLNDYCQKNMQITLNKVQHWGTDVFGIGEHLHRNYPAWWKSQQSDWDENFKNIDVEVRTNIELKSIGTIGAEIK